MSTFLFLLFGLLALYVWLRGWWFGGVIALLFLVYVGQPLDKAWLHDGAIAFAPWFLWHLPQILRWISEAADEDRARKQAAAALRREQQRPQREWLALPRAERRRRWAEYRAAHAA